MNDKLYKFMIPCQWEMCSTIRVEAKNLDEAIDIANDMDLPMDGEYVHPSFEIDHENAECCNQDVLRQIEKDKIPINNIVELAFPNKDISNVVTMKEVDSW